MNNRHGNQQQQQQHQHEAVWIAAASASVLSSKRSNNAMSLSLKRLKREHTDGVGAESSSSSNGVDRDPKSNRRRRPSKTSIFDIDDSAFDDLTTPICTGNNGGGGGGVGASAGLSRQQYAKIKADKLKRAILKNLEELKCAQREGCLSDGSLEEFNRNRGELESCDDQISLCESRSAQCDIKIAEHQERIREIRANRTQYSKELVELKKLKDRLLMARNVIIEDHPELYGQTQTFSLVENIMNTTESSDLWFVSGERCSVCYNANVRPVKIRKCSHYLCSKCIRQIIVTSKTCPICRADIEETEEFDISTLTTTVKTPADFVIGTAASANSGGDVDTLDSPDFFDNTIGDYLAAIGAQRARPDDDDSGDDDDDDDEDDDNGGGGGGAAAGRRRGAPVPGNQTQLLGIDIPSESDPQSFEYMNVETPTSNFQTLHAYAADTPARRNHILHGRADLELGLLEDNDGSTPVFSPSVVGRDNCHLLLFVDFYKSVHAAVRNILIDERESFEPHILQNLQFQLRRDSRLPESRMPSISSRRLEAFRSRYPENSVARTWLGNVYERHVRAVNSTVREHATTEPLVKSQIGAMSVWLQSTCVSYATFIQEFGLFRQYDPINLHSINYYCLYRQLCPQQ